MMSLSLKRALILTGGAIICYCIGVDAFAAKAFAVLPL